MRLKQFIIGFPKWVGFLEKKIPKRTASVSVITDRLANVWLLNRSRQYGIYPSLSQAA